MVDVSAHAPLLLAAFAKQALGGLRAFLLKALPEAMVAMPQAPKLATGVGFTIGVHRDILDAEIHPKPVFRRARRRFFDINSGEQVPLAFAEHKVGLSTAAAQHPLGVLVAHERDTLSARNGPDGHLGLLPTEDSVVVGDGSEWLENALLAPSRARPVSVGYFREQTDNELRRNREPFPHLVVTMFLELVLSERLSLPCHSADVIGCIISAAKRCLKRSGLVAVGQQLEGDGQLHHAGNISEMECFAIAKISSARFLFSLKAGIFLGGLL
jgi:hypothetical protein